MKKTFFSTCLSVMMVMMAAVAVTCVTSCTEEKFHVNGEIANAKDSVLYFEHNGLQGFTRLDSVILDESGSFSFSGERVPNPEFYRLRIAGQIINIAIDSIETVTVKATYPQMATDYEVKGSYENEKIKELALRQIRLQTQCQEFAATAEMSVDSTRAALNRIVEQYKEDICKNYIYKEPMKAYAYFALFQYITINNYSSLIFNPRENPKDIKVFGAVATSWDTYYPDSERGQNLHNIAIEGMKDQRIMRSQNEGTIQLDASGLSETGVIDLPLMDNHGKIRHLTELKGKVVLLNFHTFASDGSSQFIMRLRDIYNKYHAQGLEIYQVSLDENEHFWKTQTAALPWISVYDDGGNSQAYLAPVTTTPVFYLINRDNTIVKNPEQIKDLDSEIQALL